MLLAFICCIENAVSCVSTNTSQSYSYFRRCFYSVISIFNFVVFIQRYLFNQIHNGVPTDSYSPIPCFNGSGWQDVHFSANRSRCAVKLCTTIWTNCHRGAGLCVPDLLFYCIFAASLVNILLPRCIANWRPASQITVHQVRRQEQKDGKAEGGESDAWNDRTMCRRLLAMEHSWRNKADRSRMAVRFYFYFFTLFLVATT